MSSNQTLTSASETEFTLRPRGALTIGESVAALRQILFQLIARGHPMVVIDLARVTALDGDGLGMLVDAHGSGKRFRTEIELDNVPPSLGILVLTKLYITFTVRASYSKA